MTNKIKKVADLRSGDLLVFRDHKALVFILGGKIVYSHLDTNLIDGSGNCHGALHPNDNLSEIGVVTCDRLLEVHRPESGYAVGKTEDSVYSQKVWQRDVLEVRLNGKVVEISPETERTLLAELEKTNA